MSEFRRDRMKGETGRQTCRSQIAEVVDDSFRWTALCTNRMQNVGAKYEYASTMASSDFVSFDRISRNRTEQCSRGT